MTMLLLLLLQNAQAFKIYQFHVIIHFISLFSYVYVFCYLFAALRIHVSPFTKDILDKFGTFELDLRGPVEMKASYNY